jgi:rhodanese-related sulfurtransferase
VAVDSVPAGAVLLDCREGDEWRAGHIEAAVHVPMNQIPQRLSYEPSALARDAKIVVVCKMGGRSAQVTGWLIRHGFDAVNLEGGMLAWASSGRAMVSENGRQPIVA